MEKVKTYTIVDYSGGPDLIETRLNEIIDALKEEIEAAELDGEESLEFIIRVDKKYTQEEINNLPEWGIRSVFGAECFSG